MKRFIVSAIAFAAAAVMGFAQNPSDLAASPAVQETQDVKSTCEKFPSEALEESMNASLAKQGKALGTINSDGSIYVIGSATTARPSNQSGFIMSRNVAFNIAEMTAKQELLRMAGEQISSGRGFQMLEDIVQGEDPDAAKSAQECIDAAKDKNSPTYKQDFNQKIRSVCAGMIQGCAIVRTAEGECGGNDYQVSVCIKYSPEFQSLSNILKTGQCGAIPTGKAGDSRAKVMNMPEADLVYKLGTWVTFDPQGNMVIYGYGQNEVNETGSRASAAISRAQSQARLQAVNNIKNFVAEDLVSEEAQSQVEKLREYADGSSQYFSSSKWKNAVEAKSTTLNIATSQVRTWRAKHPVSGHTIAGVVVCWTYENAQNAKALRETLDNNARTPVSGSSAKPAAPTTRGQIVITGDDDDL